MEFVNFIVPTAATVTCISIVLSKAFDLSTHSLFLNKLNAYGMEANE